jgi:hypothetical protein
MSIYLALSFTFSVAIAGNDQTNATKSVNVTSATNNITNATKNMTNATMNTINVTKNMTMPQNMTNLTKNMTNITNPFAKIKGVAKIDPYSNNMSHPPGEVYLPTGNLSNP